MPRFGLLLGPLLLCSAGYTQDSPESSALRFWPDPLSKTVLPVDPNAAASGHASTVRPLARSEGLDPAVPVGTPTELSHLIDKLLAALDQEQSRNGERSAALIDRLTSLAAAYQDLGQYEAAVSALEDAVQIARINFGLYSLDQAEAVESLVTIQQTNGQYGEAAGHRDYLRDLVRRNADDPRTVGILTKLATSEMEIARRSLGVPAPSQLIVGTTGAYDPIRPPQTPSLAAVREARSDYIAAIQASVRTESGNAADVFALEDALVDTVYFEFWHSEVHGPSSLYTRATGGVGPSTLSLDGLRILEARVHDSLSFGRTPKQIAAALLEVADWHLVFSDFALALADYEAARDLLVQNGVPDETIDAMFSPEVPPIVPVAQADTAADPPFRGYIEASVEITRFGDVKRASIGAKSPGTSRTIEKGFRRYLAAAQFRPRFVDGEIPRSDRFAARFYFDY